MSIDGHSTYALLVGLATRQASRQRTHQYTGRDFASLVFAGQNFTDVLDHIRSTEIFQNKLAVGKPQQISVNEIEELFRILNADDSGTLDVMKLQIVLEQLFEHVSTPQPWMRPAEFIKSETSDRITPLDYHQLLLLGTPDDVKRISRKMHGVDHDEEIVQRESLIEFLRKKKNQHDSFKAMPITFSLFILVFWMVTVHFSFPSMLELNEAVSNGLKSSDVAGNFPAQFWSHFEGHVSTNSPYIGHHNQILGIRVSRKAEHPEPNGPLCQYSPWNYLWDEIRGEISGNPQPLRVCNEVTTPSSWSHWPLKPQENVLRFQTGETPKTLCQQLQAQAIAKLNDRGMEAVVAVQSGDTPKSKDLETEEDIATANCSNAVAPECQTANCSDVEFRPKWLDGRRTGTLQLEIVTYNSLLSFYTFYRIEATVLRSGAVTATDLVESFSDQPLWLDYEEDIRMGKRHVIVIDLLYLICYIFTAVLLLYNMLRSLRYKHFKMFVADFWVQVEIINIFLTFMIILGYFHCIFLVSGLNQLKASLPVFPAETYEFSIAELEEFTGNPIHVYEGHLHSVLDQASRIAQSYKDLRWYIAFFCYCSCFRFLKVFQANAKLNVVLQTVLRAGSDLLHFLIVFMSLCMAFTLVGHVLFGSQITAFSTIYSSINSVFLFLLGYLFDDVSADMLENGGILAIIWNVLFMLFLLLISLNMVLAIIFDVYAEVKEEADNEPSLIEQVAQIWKTGKMQKAFTNTLGGSDTNSFSNLASDGTRRSSKRSSKQGIRASLLKLVGSVEHAAHDMYAEAEHAAHEIAEAFQEDQILDALVMRNVHPEENVTAGSLMQAMKYHDDAYADVEEVIKAAAQMMGTEEPTGLSTKLRLVSRIDNNVREVLRWRRNGKLREPDEPPYDGLRYAFQSRACQLSETVQALEKECDLIRDAARGRLLLASHEEVKTQQAKSPAAAKTKRRHKKQKEIADASVQVGVGVEQGQPGEVSVFQPKTKPEQTIVGAPPPTAMHTNEQQRSTQTMSPVGKHEAEEEKALLEAKADSDKDTAEQVQQEEVVVDGTKTEKQSACAKGKQPRRTLDIFEEMKQRGFEELEEAEEIPAEVAVDLEDSMMAKVEEKSKGRSSTDEEV
eukprot:gnl/MRDRNA2_/MRDRNA2_95761_c0_seq1.p1 gnl/MRDRNA2_/MRDRNA2_95761_c0~~gnl/MRDRNA2_/MRDRNA2_95761_c0_seq1.p1  ORF type:complete len:1125 (+),score=224.49 gnl/MRDRNA2_/MRDRNA2_95761_c0_seq1:131-3505(+)